jgi:hypothetical protein
LSKQLIKHSDIIRLDFPIPIIRSRQDDLDGAATIEHNLREHLIRATRQTGHTNYLPRNIGVERTTDGIGDQSHRVGCQV